MYNGLVDGKHEYEYVRSLSDGVYSVGISIAKEIRTAFPSNPVKVQLKDAQAFCRFDTQLTAGEESSLDQLVTDHSSSVLQEAKDIKNSIIDNRTVELINQGFVFDSKVFSLSEPAQINWVGIKTLEAIMTFPVSITTKDDEQYALAQADLDAFMGQALGTKQAHLDSGRALKLQVNAATTVAAVDAIVDNR